jgi:hypothetical protein
MGVVTEYLNRLIARQVDEQGIVVWFDPENQYEAMVSDLAIPETTIACYEGSFFALRHRIEPLLGGDEPPRLVVYVPLEQTQTRNALAEIEAAGAILKPGQPSLPRNTRLSVIARHALKSVLGESAVASIEKDVEARKLTLADLDHLGNQGESLTKGVVSLIFGTGESSKVALEFLGDEKRDSEIVRREAGAELAVIFNAAFGIELPNTAAPQEMRARLARHILVIELLNNLRGPIPPQLSTIETIARPALVQACVELARN